MSEIKLAKISTRSGKEIDKNKTKDETRKMLDKINPLQNLLFAESKHALLIVIQGMDASGKDGVIRKVFGGMNPQGVLVKSFKAPTMEENSHDFLWRIHAHAPAKGIIQIFNRSHYEDILITRVHGACDKATARKRMEAINNWEELISENNNTTILKFYLHVSKEEQSSRLQERLEDPTKMWKNDQNDLVEAELWDNYMDMYEDCFSHCNKIPWHIVPSDQNWFKESIITAKILETLEGFDMKYPGLEKQ